MVFCSSLFSKDSDEKFIPFLVEKPLIEYKMEKKHNTNRSAAYSTQQLEHAQGRQLRFMKDMGGEGVSSLKK
jgi:hypothetical protein